MERETMEEYFGPHGRLAQTLPSFELRSFQLEMAGAVDRCLSEETPLLVEAGTGTGKTWAYLIPAILSGKKVVVSTGTKTLQDQIFDYDIPLLREKFFEGLQAVCLKGRKNYLCLRRFQEVVRQPKLWHPEEARSFTQLQKWAYETETGDRSEIPWLPDHSRTWDDISSSSDQCLGQQCKEFKRCFLNQIRFEAAKAQILVVNHHLFFADLALRRAGSGGVLPDYDGVVFDEAHQLEDIIASYLGIQFSNYKLEELVRDVRRELREESGGDEPKKVVNACIHLAALAKRAHRYFSQLPMGYGRYRLWREELGKSFENLCDDLIQALKNLSAALIPHSEDRPGLETCDRRARDLQGFLQLLLDQQDASLVYWYEVTPHAAFLNATPLDVASILQKELFENVSAVVFTSATLSAAGSFDFIRERLGIPDESRERLFPSPFAYEDQAMLYIPENFPLPADPAFCSSMAEEALKVLAKTHGRALFLFTSYQNLHQTHDLLHGRLPFPVMLQGEKPKRSLLAEFKEKVESVLMATGSFWQGIDVPGEALSCVLIDKLPFEVPSDPVVAARMERLAKEGKSAFYHYQVPRAIIALKQGVGRLIRSSLDRGLIVIFDVRLLQKTYGRLFLKSLPPCRRVREPEGIEPFEGPDAAPQSTRLTSSSFS